MWVAFSPRAAPEPPFPLHEGQIKEWIKNVLKDFTKRSPQFVTGVAEKFSGWSVETLRTISAQDLLAEVNAAATDGACPVRPVVSALQTALIAHRKGTGSSLPLAQVLIHSLGRHLDCAVKNPRQ